MVDKLSTDKISCSLWIGRLSTVTDWTGGFAEIVHKLRVPTVLDRARLTLLCDMSPCNAIGRRTDVRSCRDWGIKATCNLLICARKWLYINTGTVKTECYTMLYYPMYAPVIHFFSYHSASNERERERDVNIRMRYFKFERMIS